jgi:hypothetical protein
LVTLFTRMLLILSNKSCLNWNLISHLG